MNVERDDTTGQTPQNVRIVIPRIWHTRAWLYAIFIGLGILLLYTVWNWLGSLVTGLLLLALLYSINERLVVRLDGRRAVAAAASIAVLLAAVLVPGYIVVRKFVAEATEAQATIEPQIDELRLQLQEAIASAGAGSQLAAFIDETSASLFALAAGIGVDIMSNTIQLTLHAIVLLLVLFFLLRDAPLLIAAGRRLSPVGPDYFNLFALRFRYVTIGVLKGVIVVALVQSAIGGLTLYLVGVPGVWLWTILMAVLSLIPLFGTWMVMYPLALIEIANGNVTGGVVILLMTTFVITTVDNILRPILVGQQARMHTLVALFATAGGMVAFGAAGVFIGPVIAAMFVAMLELYRKELLPPAATSGTSPEVGSVAVGDSSDVAPLEPPS